VPALGKAGTGAIFKVRLALACRLRAAMRLRYAVPGRVRSAASCA